VRIAAKANAGDPREARAVNRKFFVNMSSAPLICSHSSSVPICTAGAEWGLAFSLFRWPCGPPKFVKTPAYGEQSAIGSGAGEAAADFSSRRLCWAEVPTAA
jgi:hypothetical protein